MTTLPSSSSSITPAQPSMGSTSSQCVSKSAPQLSEEARNTITNALRAAHGNFSELSLTNQKQLKELGPSITKLDLSSLEIPEGGLEQVPVLFPNLKQLSLHEAVVNEGMPPLPKLEVLDVSSAPVASLGKYRALQEVNISKCEELSSSSISTLLVFNYYLKKVALSESRIVRLSNALPELVFMDCSLCVGLVEDGLDMLAKSSKLDTLLLKGTRIQCLPNKLPVRKLDLDCCKGLHMDMFTAMKTYPNLTELVIDLVYVECVESSTVKRLEVTLNDFKSTPQEIAEKVAKVAPAAFDTIRKRCPKLETVVLRLGDISEAQQQTIKKQLAPLSVTFEKYTAAQRQALQLQIATQYARLLQTFE